MRVIVAGGGTGGHIYPALAIADKIKENDPDAEILYLGNRDGLEIKIVPKTGYKMKLVPARWIDKKNIIQLARTGARNIAGIIACRFIMSRFKPDVVIGTGGYLCVPVIFAASRYKTKCFLHEQNAFPGIANRHLEKFVDKMFLGFEEAGEFFADKSKLITTGNPVRDSFYKADKDLAREKLGIPKDAFTVFSFGGSLGAPTINEASFELMKKLNGKSNSFMIFGTGRQNYEQLCEKVKASNISLSDNIMMKPYIDDMENYLAASDLIISRAGALSVAETNVCGKAAILIPYPLAAGNHQYFNAKSVADQGGAILIEEKNLSPQRLVEEVMRLKENPQILSEMSEASRRCAPDMATEIIYDEIMKEVK